MKELNVCVGKLTRLANNAFVMSPIAISPLVDTSPIRMAVVFTVPSHFDSFALADDDGDIDFDSAALKGMLFRNWRVIRRLGLGAFAPKRSDNARDDSAASSLTDDSE